MPFCVAYAILQHRVFDIRIIIRQGLQYAAARGLLLSLTPVVARRCSPISYCTAINRSCAFWPNAAGCTLP